MSLSKYGDKGSQGNRISSANSFASYIMYKYKLKRFTITPGIRYESIDLERNDYGKSNPQRNKNEVSYRQNKVSVFIPGFGLNYSFNNNVSMLVDYIKVIHLQEVQRGRKLKKALILKLELDFHIKNSIQN